MQSSITDVARSIDEVTRDVERDENGIVYLSPYGWQVKEIDGKKYVVANTVEEYEAALARDGLARKPSVCLGGGIGGQCYPTGECTSCTPVYNSGVWYCYCN